jgi:hypothetical protein
MGHRRAGSLLKGGQRQNCERTSPESSHSGPHLRRRSGVQTKPSCLLRIANDPAEPFLAEKAPIPETLVLTAYTEFRGPNLNSFDDFAYLRLLTVESAGIHGSGNKKSAANWCLGQGCPSLLTPVSLLRFVLLLLLPQILFHGSPFFPRILALVG